MNLSKELWNGYVDRFINKEVEVLDSFEIDYKKYLSCSELLDEIEEVIESSEDEELEDIAISISDRNYYLFYNK